MTKNYIYRNIYEYLEYSFILVENEKMKYILSSLKIKERKFVQISFQ